MKTVVIYGQKHKGNTYELTRLLLEQLNQFENSVQEFYVNEIEHCVGCCQCIMKDETLCPHRQQVEPIIQAMEEADVIVLATPNYCYNMSGQLKTFCDHLAYRWMAHRPYDMRGKVGIAISTAAGAGASVATKAVKRQMQWWSIGRVYRINFIVNAPDWKQVKPKRKKRLEAKVSRIARKVRKRSRKKSACLKVRILFAIMKKVQLSNSWNEVERVHWESMK